MCFNPMDKFSLTIIYLFLVFYCYTERMMNNLRTFRGPDGGPNQRPGWQISPTGGLGQTLTATALTLLSPAAHTGELSQPSTRAEGGMLHGIRAGTRLNTSMICSPTTPGLSQHRVLFPRGGQSPTVIEIWGTLFSPLSDFCLAFTGLRCFNLLLSY